MKYVTFNGNGSNNQPRMNNQTGVSPHNYIYQSYVLWYHASLWKLSSPYNRVWRPRGGVEVQLIFSLTSALDRHGWLVPHPGWALGPVNTGKENLIHTRVQTTDHPSHSVTTMATLSRLPSLCVNSLLTQLFLTYNYGRPRRHHIVFHIVFHSKLQIKILPASAASFHSKEEFWQLLHSRRIGTTWTVSTCSKL